MPTLKDQHSQASRIANLSHALWHSVNTHITQILAAGIKNKLSRKQIAATLRRAAGPKKKNEPVCLCNYRRAANNVETSGDMSVL